MNWLIYPTLFAALSGCDALGINTPAKQQAAIEADGRAIGSACRHAGRAIEDCYALNDQASKSAIFNGWRDMNDYMTKNKIDTVMPLIAAKEPVKKEAKKDKEKEKEKEKEKDSAPPAVSKAQPSVYDVLDKPAGESKKEKSSVSPQPYSSLAPADNGLPGKQHQIAEVSPDEVMRAKVKAHTP